MQNPNTPEVLEEMFKVRQLIERMATADSAEKILCGLGI
jgi:DNA-binding GntR family transcriptional regulator